MDHMAFLPRIFAAVLTVAALASCGSFPPNPPPQEKTESPIAGCAGGGYREVILKIEADYSKILATGASGSVQFKDGIVTALTQAGVPADVRAQYVACYEKIDARIRAQNDRNQCLSTCSTERNFCTTNITKKYDSCIQGGVAACLVECARTTDKGLSACKSMCSTDKPYNVGNWEERRGCTQSTSSCDASVGACRSACPALKFD